MAQITVIQPKAATSKSTCVEIRRRKVAGYARVSTDRDEQFTSYEAQVDHYTNFIKSRTDWDFVNVYTDEGITGTSTKHRTGFNTMIQDALAGKIDLIVTKSVSRFARNTVDSLTTIRMLKEHGTEVYFEKENIWTFDGKGELIITIMSSLAQEESRSISENVTWGMREAMRQGKASVPYKVFLGYDRGPDGSMVINPEQAILVRRIFGMFIQGMSPYHIGKILESEGNEFSKGTKRWYPSTICSILQNEKYKGDALRQKTYSKDFLTKERVKNDGILRQYYIRDHHEAIVGPDLFERAREELLRRGTTEEKREGHHLFSKRVRCADCGSWYGVITWFPGTKYERDIWRCNKKYQKGKAHCTPPAVSEDLLKTAFVNALNCCLEENGVNPLLNAITKSFSYTGYQAEADDLEREMNIVSNLLEKADSLHRDNLIRRMTLANERLHVVQNEIRALLTQKAEMKTIINSMAKEETAMEFRKELFLSLVDYMTVVSHKKIMVTFKGGKTIFV